MRYAIVYAPDGSEKALTYEQYLQSPEWANKRLGTLKGVSGCQFCARKARLDVHQAAVESNEHYQQVRRELTAEREIRKG